MALLSSVYRIAGNFGGNYISQSAITFACTKYRSDLIYWRMLILYAAGWLIRQTKFSSYTVATVTYGHHLANGNLHQLMHHGHYLAAGNLQLLHRLASSAHSV